MKGSVKVKNLRKIILLYDDGSAIALPEDKTLKVGTAFMKVIGTEQINWEILTPEKSSLKEKVKKFFAI